MKPELTQFCGEVVATDHLEEMSGTSMDGTGYTWTDVQRQVWIRAADGNEREFTFTNVAVPARTGHRVTLLRDAERPVALINFSTEQYINLVALEQFELFGVMEAFAFAALLIVAGFTAPAGIVLLVSDRSGCVWAGQESREAPSLPPSVRVGRGADPSDDCASSGGLGRRSFAPCGILRCRTASSSSAG